MPPVSTVVKPLNPLGNSLFGWGWRPVGRKGSSSILLLSFSQGEDCWRPSVGKRAWNTACGKKALCDHFVHFIRKHDHAALNKKFTRQWFQPWNGAPQSQHQTWLWLQLACHSGAHISWISHPWHWPRVAGCHRCDAPRASQSHTQQFSKRPQYLRECVNTGALKQTASWSKWWKQKQNCCRHSVSRLFFCVTCVKPPSDWNSLYHPKPWWFAASWPRSRGLLPLGISAAWHKPWTNRASRARSLASKAAQAAFFITLTGCSDKKEDKDVGLPRYFSDIPSHKHEIGSDLHVVSPGLFRMILPGRCHTFFI